MTALSLAAFANNSAFSSQQSLTAQPKGMNSVDAFHDALSRHAGVENVAAMQPQAAQPVTDPAAVSDPKAIHADNGLDASTVERERVRASLGLDGAVVPPRATTGDTILGGIQKLRSVFDDRTHHIGDLMKSNMATTQSLMSMQMEVAQYTVMVDVSSKLMGKASSSLDTLMKGQ